MVSTRGHKPQGDGRPKSPLGEVDHNRRSSRLANATYPKRQVDTDDEEGEGEDAVNDVEELGEEDEEEEEVDDDDEEDEEARKWRKYHKKAGAGSKEPAPRRSTRLSVPGPGDAVNGSAQDRKRRRDGDDDNGDDGTEDGLDHDGGMGGHDGSAGAATAAARRSQERAERRAERQGEGHGAGDDDHMDVEDEGAGRGGKDRQRGSKSNGKSHRASDASHGRSKGKQQHGDRRASGRGAGSQEQQQQQQQQARRSSARLSGLPQKQSQGLESEGEGLDADGTEDHDHEQGGGEAGPSRRAGLRSTAAGMETRRAGNPRVDTSDEGGEDSDSGHEEDEDDGDTGRGGREGRRVLRRGAAGSGAAGEDDAEDEGEEDEGEEEDEEEEEEHEDVVVKGRYTLRGHGVNALRAGQHPAKRARYGEAAAGGSRRNAGHADEDDEDEDDDEDDEEEEDDDEEVGRRGGRKGRDGRKRGGRDSGPRYTLRDRSRLIPLSVQQQQQQRAELERELRARKRFRERARAHHGGGGGHGGKHHGGGGGGGGGGSHRRGGGGWRGGVSEDDVLDVEGPGGSHPWRNVHLSMGALPPWQQPMGAPNTPLALMPGAATAHGGAQMVPSSAAQHNANPGLHFPGAAGGLPTPGGAGGGAGAGGGLPLAPWEAALVADAAAVAAAGGKEKAGNAEINPVAVDPSVGFDQVGGLDTYIDALKEMVFLPLVYPELFTRFSVTPPRGVLFYGPPGTGKTLVARALASHASRYGGRKVSFYMRKGADVLSKWVGEAERQLRLLFEEAQKNAPSIIFFDEIDGLAPVRSSRQDQIHNSIVSTLLALMDGLDSRGQVVIIGATNRPDSLDGALRRPGRFDRELLFPLPGLQARRSILDIHTRKWSERPPPELLDELAGQCVGYCGADLKAVCAEAALHAVRRRYPQIYASEDKLLVQPSQVVVERQDFLAAIASITPASHRSAAAHARPLPPATAPALAHSLAAVLGRLQRTFPPAAQCLAAAASREGPSSSNAATNTTANATTALLLPPGRTAAAPPKPGALGALALPSTSASSASTSGPFGGLLARLPSFLLSRPRLLVCGPPGCGQGQLAAALLYALEGLPCHAIGLPSLLANAGARSPEEALVGAFVEARRAAPAVLFLPHLHLWWRTASPQLRATLVMLLRDLPPELPLLLLATAERPHQQLDRDLRAADLFRGPDHVLALEQPRQQQRRDVLKEPILAAAEPADPAFYAPQLEAAVAAGGSVPSGPAPEPLPKDPSVAAAREADKAAAEAMAARQAYEEDQSALRALRIALRGVTLTLLNDRRWKLFAAPVGMDEDPEYWQLVRTPMDLATILARVDGKQYGTTAQYLADVALIVQAAKDYFGSDAQGARHVSRAAALEDEAGHLVTTRVPLDLAARCEAMRVKGGPAPPPPGVEVPEALAAARGAKGREAGARGAATNGGSAGAEVAARVTRQRAGAGAGRTAEGRVLMFEDPEVLMRRNKLRERELQNREQGQASGAGAGAGEGAGAAAGAGPGPSAAGAVEAAEGEATSPHHVDEARGLEGGAAAADKAAEDAEMGSPGAAHPRLRWKGSPVVGGTQAEAEAALQGEAGQAAQAEAGGGVRAGGGSGGNGVELPAFGSAQELVGMGVGDQAAPMEVDGAAGMEQQGRGSGAREGAGGSQGGVQEQQLVEVGERLQEGGGGGSEGQAVGVGGGAVQRDEVDPEAVREAEELLSRVVGATEGWSLEELEALYVRAAGVVLEHRGVRDRRGVVAALEQVLVEAVAQHQQRASLQSA